MLQQTASRQLSIFLPVLCSSLRCVSATKLSALASRGASVSAARTLTNVPVPVLESSGESDGTEGSDSSPDAAPRETRSRLRDRIALYRLVRTVVWNSAALRGSASLRRLEYRVHRADDPLQGGCATTGAEEGTASRHGSSGSGSGS